MTTKTNVKPRVALAATGRVVAGVALHWIRRGQVVVAARGESRGVSVILWARRINHSIGLVSSLPV